MIMPCMNSTSACDSGGSVALVEGGSVLLGFPGAPGCTTTGGVAESPCCARPEAQRKAVAALATSSMPHTTPAPVAALNFFSPRKLCTSPFASHLNIFNVPTLKIPRHATTQRCSSHLQKSPGSCRIGTDRCTGYHLLRFSPSCSAGPRQACK